MSLFGGITDFLTSGANSQAEQALNDALAAYNQAQVPTAQQLSLPELQQYVNAGLMTPAQAQAYLQQSNAFAQENIPQTGTDAMVQSLGQLSSIADSGPMGTPVEQAQAAQNIEGLNTNLAGQRGAIEQQMEAKGTPASMVQAAMANQYMGQDAQQAYLNALNQQAAAYQAQVQALSEKANVGGALQGQQNTQANTVAQAQNAMQQFNAANQQTASAQNAGYQQQANQINQTNAQNVANQNTGLKNARTAYNTNLPQQVFNDQMTKANALSNVYSKQANQYMDQGKQNAGTASGTLGTLSDVGSIAALSAAMPTPPNNYGSGTIFGTPAVSEGTAGAFNAGSTILPAALSLAHGGMVDEHAGCYHEGGICMKGGGMVPGSAKVPGDSLKNDTVHVMASPGEAVIPRTAVQTHPGEVMGLIAHGGNMPHGGIGLPHPGAGGMHPHDVASVLQALREIRMGVS